MASDEELITANNLDYLRFVLLLVEEGTAVVRKIVDSGLDESENDLSEFLRINENEIRRSKRITGEQKQLLYPSSGQKSDILKWDISLLAHIALKYFTTEKSEDHRAVEKLRDWRNKYFHRGNAAVDDGEFEDLSNVIRTISQKYSRDDPTKINDVIVCISRLDLHPALEKLKIVEPKLSEHIEGMFGMIKGQFVNLERCVQQTNQEVRELREEIRKVAERDGSEVILPVYTLHGLVHATLRPDNPEALAEVMKRLYSESQRTLQHTDSSSHVEKMVANVSQDIRDIGGEVVDVQQGSVVYVIHCSSITTLMYVIDYFYSPRMRFRLANIANDLSKDVDEEVELISDILPKSLQAILQKMQEGNNTDTTYQCPPPMSKFNAILAKRKRKKARPELDLVQQTETINQKRELNMTESRKLLASIDNHANRCREIINEMQDMFNKTSDTIRQYPHVKAWIKELGDIEKKLEFKPTVIAVIGNTGQGKSSLLNAVLDKRDVLPTSGLDSCTATVVEIVQSDTDFFQAEIEFLKEEEWFDEFRNLCKDLEDVETVPDKSSGIYKSYTKIKSLYGEVADFDILSKKTELTQWLGRIIHIQSEKLDEFKKKVESYIEVQEPGTERCFWPIVKRVLLKLPECDACSSGGVLVDLPGRGDSDVTRNAIAKSYLEKCDRIWIVSSINRAINDRTAQELLGEHYRSQFYMNGQLDAVSFICTKTDVVYANEIQRKLKQLNSLTKERQEELSELDKRIKELEKHINDQSKKIQELTLSIEQDKKDVADVKSVLEDESDQDEEAMDGENEDIQKDLENMERNIEANEQKLRDLKIELQKLKEEQNEKIKAIDEICAKERNRYCETRIKEDFASCYEAIRSASKTGSADRHDAEQIQQGKNLTSNLKVFCCSSTEYQMHEHMEPTDAGPKVFSKVEDTQIPKLRNFVHEITSARRKESMKDTICTLDGLVTGIQTFLTDEEAMKQLDQSFTKETIDSELKNLKLANDSTLDKLKSDLSEIFDKKLIVILKTGASAAADEANDICRRWGAKHSRNRSQVGGLHHKTYQAAVKRHGVYIDIDFNEDLAQPIFTHIAVQWGNTFMTVNGSVWKAVDAFKVAVLQNRKSFVDKLLDSFGIPNDVSEVFSETQDYRATIRVNNTIKELQDEISFKHRTIPGVVTPHIQSCLSDVYSECAEIKGKGMLENVKSKLSSEINEKRKTMFAQIADMMTSELHGIQKHITNQLTEMGNILTEDLITALEPLWDDKTILRSAFSEDIGKLSLKVKGVLDEFSSDTKGPAQKRQKLQAQPGSPEAMQGCSK